MVRLMQTSSFLNMRKNFLPWNLTMAPCYPSLISHLGCINMRVLHTSAIPGGACMALVLHCDTNQGRWQAPLSCKHQSLLVLFKCLPSLFLLSLTLTQPLPRFTLHPWLQPSLSASPFFSSQSKSAAEKKTPIPGLLPKQASLLGVNVCLIAWGCFQAQPRPFHIQMLQSGPWPTGGSLWLRPQVAGSRWWFNSSSRGKKRGCQVI